MAAHSPQNRTLREVLRELDREEGRGTALLPYIPSSEAQDRFDEAVHRTCAGPDGLHPNRRASENFEELARALGNVVPQQRLPRSSTMARAWPGAFAGMFLAVALVPLAPSTSQRLTPDVMPANRIEMFAAPQSGFVRRIPQPQFDIPGPLEAGVGVPHRLNVTLLHTEGLGRDSRVVIDGVPEFAGLSAGRPIEKGKWIVAPGDLPGLKIVSYAALEHPTELRLSLQAPDGVTAPDAKMLLMVAAPPAGPAGKDATRVLAATEMRAGASPVRSAAFGVKDDAITRARTVTARAKAKAPRKAIVVARVQPIPTREAPTKPPVELASVSPASRPPPGFPPAPDPVRQPVAAAAPQPGMLTVFPPAFGLGAEAVAKHDESAFNVREMHVSPPSR